MNINISNNLHTQSYNPAAKKNKGETSSFTIPDTDEQTPFDVSDAHSKGKISDEDFRIFQNDLISRARMLPPDVMNGNRLLEFQETQTAKIVFEFGEGGSIRIKEGLSPADYTRAKKALNDYEFWLNGGTLLK